MNGRGCLGGVDINTHAEGTVRWLLDCLLIILTADTTEIWGEAYSVHPSYPPTNTICDCRMGVNLPTHTDVTTVIGLGLRGLVIPNSVTNKSWYNAATTGSGAETVCLIVLYDKLRSQKHGVASDLSRLGAPKSNQHTWYWHTHNHVSETTFI
jgi:hypothetical protein